MHDFVTHTFPPFFDEHSKILILGTIPSPKSREEGFYYAHPQNRFWRILSDLFHENKPLTVEDKKDFLHRHSIALWDVLDSCMIDGAEDSSIRNPTPNDLSLISEHAPIKAVFTTGATAFKLYKKLIGNDAIALPSTSPANCRMTYESMLLSYRLILNYLT